MNYLEFMKLPLESRKAIEQRILELDQAVQDAYGISLMQGDLETIGELLQRQSPEH